MMRGVYGNTTEVQSLAPAARAASANGAAADLHGYIGALVLITAGAWTDGEHSFALQDSDDGQAFTAVAAKDLQGTLPTIDSEATGGRVYAAGYVGSKRYLRVVATVEDAEVGAVYGAVIVRSHPRTAPTR